MTFDNDALLVRRIMFTLGEEFNDGELELLLKDLEDHGFRVVYVEEMNNPREVETIETQKPSHMLDGFFMLFAKRYFKITLCKWCMTE